MDGIGHTFRSASGSRQLFYKRWRLAWLSLKYRKVLLLYYSYNDNLLMILTNIVIIV